VRFGLSTTSRWLYAARKARRDPVGVLRRKVRKDLGTQDSVNAAVQLILREQYTAHTNWSIQLHYLNLKALAEARPSSLRTVLLQHTPLLQGAGLAPAPPPELTPNRRGRTLPRAAVTTGGTQL